MRGIRNVVALLVLMSAVVGSPATARPLSIAYQLTYAQQMDPSPSPDGKTLVYIVVINGKEQFFLIDSTGRNSRQITNDDADHEDPAWSPDGRKIAFTRLSGDNEQIYLMNPDGSGQEELTPPAHRTIHPSWSPDSKVIVYCTDDDLKPPAKNDSQIYSLDLATRRASVLISGGVNTYPGISPDGKKIVFRRMVDTLNSEVFVADRDGSHQVNLTNHPSFDGWPAWSPDGSLIAFASNRNFNYQIFVMNSDGSNVRLVADTSGRGTAPKWAPDGKSIYFSDCINHDIGVSCDIMVAPLGSPP